MHRVAFAALLSHWRRHPLQVIGLVLGLALATALWSGVQAINAEARASYAWAANLLQQDQLDRLYPVGDATLPQKAYVDLRRSGWLVSPVVQGNWRQADTTVRVLGIDPVTAPGGVPSDDPGAFDLPGFVTTPGQGFATAQTIDSLSGLSGLPPLMASETLPHGTILVDVGIAQTLLKLPERLSYLVVYRDQDQPLGRPDWKQIAPGLARRPASDETGLASLTESFHLNLTAFGLLAFAVGLFITHGAIGLAFEQRRAMFRTLRAVGVPMRSLVVLLVAEVTVLALLAGTIGVALGYFVAAALLPDVAATLRGLYGAALPGSLALRFDWLALGLAMAVGGAWLASAQSLWRMARLPVLSPAKPRAWARASAQGLWRQAAAGGILAAVALALAFLGKGLVAGFAMLGAVLLAAALFLPLLLVAGLSLARRMSKRVTVQWFWADTSQQLPGLSLALMALLLALAANVGVGTMVSSFRLTFLGWLDQRLVSEIYVSGRTEAEAAQLRDWLEPRSDAVLPIWSIEGPLGGRPGRIYGVADHATYRDHWPLLSAAPQAWDKLAAGQGVLINEQLSRRSQLSAGDRVAIPGGADRLPVLGVYSDYGNPRGQAMIGQELFERLYPQAPRLRHAVRVDPDQASDLAWSLIDEFGLPPAHVTEQAAAKDESRRIFERTFAVTAALNVLTLSVAGLALLISLLTLSGMRLPQLAPVWAMGMTRRALARAEVLRALALAGFTMVLAMPVGLVLAWVLLSVVNVAAFGWQLPMAFFPADWLRLAGLALLAGGAAAVWPAVRLMRMAPGDLVRVFANER